MDYKAITDALEYTGVFGKATLLDPEAIVWVTLNLANSKNPNDYMMWLKFYAEHYQVSARNLARDVLKVLSHCGKWVGAEMADRAKDESRQLELTAA